MIPNGRATSSRKCTYLTQSRHGIFVFRWNVISDGKHHQPRISLKTRNYLKAIGLASTLARSIQDITNPTVDQVKRVYQEFSAAKAEETIRLSQIDILPLLEDLAPKSQKEYISCWQSFLDSVDSDSLSLSGVTQGHIDVWKATQTCGESTLKKKLRLLSSCFEKTGVICDMQWFRLKVQAKKDKERRAFTDDEVRTIYRHTAKFKNTTDNWKFYLPRLALITGCRLNELAQLRVEDIVLGQSPYLSVNDFGDDKRVKNNASVRKVPLTSYALKLLEPLVIDKAISQRLFESLPYSELNGYTGLPSKFFSRLCRETLNLSNVSFHSFRHYAVTCLFNNGVKEELIGQIVGHSTGKLTTGKVYLSGFNDSLRLQAMQYLTDANRLFDLISQPVM